MKITGIGLASVLMLIIISLLLLRSAKVQTLIVKNFIEKIEDKIHADIHLGQIKVKFPKQIQFNDIVVWDQLGDTLLAVPKTNLSIRSYNFKEREFKFGKIELVEPFVYLQEDPGGGLNLSFIINSFKRDSVNKPFYLDVKELNLTELRFKYHQFLSKPVPGRISSEYIELLNANIRIKELTYDSESLNFLIDQINALEGSGFQLTESQGIVYLDKKGLSVTNLNMLSANSLLALTSAELTVDKDSTLKFLDRINLQLDVDKQTSISESDIQFFIPDFSGERSISIAGAISFADSKLDWKNARINYQDLSRFRGDLAISDFSKLSSMEFNIKVDELSYNAQNHNETLLGQFIDPDTLNLPFSLDSLGIMNMEGSFKGTMASFTTQGSFESGLGDAMGYVIAEKTPEHKSFVFKGALVGSLYHPGEWMKSKDFSDSLKFDSKFTGEFESKEKHKIDADINIRRMRFKEYVYKDLRFLGHVRDKHFDGHVSFLDKNLDLALDAQLNLKDSIPEVDFELAMGFANLRALNLNQMDSVELVELNMVGSFFGTSIDNVVGQIWIRDSYYQNSRRSLPIEELGLSIEKYLGQKRVTLVSEYIDARLLGDIYLAELLPQVIGSGKEFLPVKIETDVIETKAQNDFTFNVNLKNPGPVFETLTPSVLFRENTSLSGFFREGGQSLFIEGIIPQFLLDEKLFTGLTFTVEASEDSVHLLGGLDRVQFNSRNDFKNINMEMVLVPDEADIKLSWRDRDSVLSEGLIKPTFKFESGIGIWPKMLVHIPSTRIIHQDTVWQLDDFNMMIDKSLTVFDSLRISHNHERLMIDGSISNLPEDTLYVRFEKLNLAHLETFTGGNKKFNFKGVVDGESKFFDLHDKGLFLADVTISDFTVNEELLGETRILSNRRANSDEIYMAVSTKRGDISTLGLNGFFNPNNDQIHFDLNLDKLRMNVFNAVLDPILKDIRGIASGTVNITGTRSDPELRGEINMQKGAFYVGPLNTRYTFTHPIKITPDGFWVEKLEARDKNGNQAIVNGGIKHNKFKDLALDFKIDANKFLCLDISESMGNQFWGTAYGTGVVILAGPLKNIRIDVNATTEAGTDFAIPVSKSKNVRKIDFIRYVEKEVDDVLEDLISYDEITSRNEYNVDLSGLELNLDIAVTPEARAQIIIDSESGDVIRAFGRGNLNIMVDTRGIFSLSGEYLIDQGNYQFTLQNMPLKRFELEPGGSVKFSGPIETARIDIDANYSTNAALYDLILDESNPDLRTRTPVECHLLMTGFLENPTLEFDIVLPPNSNDIARSQLSNLAQDEINKQVFSLLILNQFSPLPGISSGNPRSYEGAGITTTTEVLSNQLNYLLSQITNDFDIGFNYLPGDELTSDEVAVALRAQLLENRMIINVNGNVDVRSVETDANQLVGDVEVEYKITPSGKLRVKAFTRANDRLLYEYSQYTQGFGIFFREEFDTFGELIRNYWNGITNNRGGDTKKD